MSDPAMSGYGQTGKARPRQVWSILLQKADRKPRENEYTP